MTHSQFGEDLIVDELLGKSATGCAVEIGAGDGQHLSNTALFRERGWSVFLVEADPVHEESLRQLEADGDPHVMFYLTAATPKNINRMVPGHATFVSIDVDGDDYFLLEALFPRPEVICVEYNPTMPRDVDICPARLGLKIGASIPALQRVAGAKGYGLVAVTPCNAIFQLDAVDIDVEPVRPDYVVCTDYFTGRPLVVGTAPWGVDFTNPFPAEDVVVRKAP